MICQRLGCERHTRPGEPCCSSACKAVLNETHFANRLAEALGRSDPIDSYITAAEALNIALTAAHSKRAELQALAAEAGWTAADFARLIRGELTVAQQDPDTGPPQIPGDPHPGAEPK